MYVKCHSIFSVKSKKNIISFSSAESAQNVLSFKTVVISMLEQPL